MTLGCIAQNGEKVAAGSCDDKPVPDGMGVPNPGVQYKKDDPCGVSESTSQQPNETFGGDSFNKWHCGN